MRKLILHPGWSKTGTSAVQAALNGARNQLIKAGILYPKSLQQVDCAHHKFALAFQSSGPYNTPHSKEEVIQMALDEMQSESCKSLLLSSELSPFYFDHPEFRSFAASHFDSIEVVFTVRRQSDCLRSLFSQLVTDPNVRYKQSLFFLFAKNITYLDYFHSVNRWIGAVGEDSVRLIEYSNNVVNSFLGCLGVDLRQQGGEKLVHESINTLYLMIIQEHSKTLEDPTKFRLRKKHLIRLLDKMSEANTYPDKVVLFSSGEQLAVDQHYEESNKKLHSIAPGILAIKSLEKRSDIMCYCPKSFSLMLKEFK